MPHVPINFAQKFSLFTEQWQPKVIAELNDYQFKISRLQGEFIWHNHPTTDEAFLVLDGTLRIDFRDGATRGPQEAGFASWGGSVTLNAGELFAVLKRVEHHP